LLAIIIIPLRGPKKHKTPATIKLSNLAVNENGYLENARAIVAKHHHYQ